MAESEQRAREEAMAPARRALLRLIRSEPGSPLSHVAQKYPHGFGSLYLHLAALEKQGFVKSRQAGRLRLLFPIEEGEIVPRPAGTPSPELSETARRVAGFIALHPGLDVAEIKTKLRLPRRTAYYHVENLVEEGYVKSSAERGFQDLRATPKLIRKLGLEP
jgi:DNA-binding IclR family transcriptional regulator